MHSVVAVLAPFPVFLVGPSGESLRLLDRVLDLMHQGILCSIAQLGVQDNFISLSVIVAHVAATHSLKAQSNIAKMGVCFEQGRVVDIVLQSAAGRRVSGTLSACHCFHVLTEVVSVLAVDQLVIQFLFRCFITGNVCPVVCPDFLQGVHVSMAPQIIPGALVILHGPLCALGTPKISGAIIAHRAVVDLPPPLSVHACVPAGLLPDGFIGNTCRAHFLSPCQGVQVCIVSVLAGVGISYPARIVTARVFAFTQGI